MVLRFGDKVACPKYDREKIKPGIAAWQASKLHSRKKHVTLLGQVKFICNAVGTSQSCTSWSSFSITKFNWRLFACSLRRTQVINLLWFLDLLPGLASSHQRGTHGSRQLPSCPSMRLCRWLPVPPRIAFAYACVDICCVYLASSIQL